MTKSLPKKQRGPQTPYLFHHCSTRDHTRPNCFKLHALKKNDAPHASSSSPNNDGLLKQVVDVLLSIVTYLSRPSKSHGNPNTNSTPHGTPSLRVHPTWVRRGSQSCILSCIVFHFVHTLCEFLCLFLFVLCCVRV